MDIQGIFNSAKDIVEKYIIPNMGTVLLAIAGISAGLIVLRIILAALWENILVGIIKISEKNNHKKEDE